MQASDQADIPTRSPAYWLEIAEKNKGKQWGRLWQ
jgi:hypothetical protein